MQTKSYPRIDRRKNRAWRLFGRGYSAEEVASRMEVHRATAYRYLAEWREQQRVRAES